MFGKGHTQIGIQNTNILNYKIVDAQVLKDRLCGLVVRVPGYISRGPGSIPSSTRFYDKYCVWNGVHSAS
jgi:hypothetical protein